MSSHRRLLNELSKLNNEYKLDNIDGIITYKLHTIDSSTTTFRVDLNFSYKNTNYDVKIYYNRLYPFHSPTKLEINNVDLFKLYSSIIFQNNKLLKNNYCLCCCSLLCSDNWNVSKNTNDILKEIEKVINYKQLYIKTLLFSKIIQKYTNQDMDYLIGYLVNDQYLVNE